MSEEYSRRDGRGIRWKMVSKTCMGESEVTGFTIDDLDSKALEDARSAYESVFITIREQMESCESSCMDVESERLNLCQMIADALKSGGLIRG